MSDIDPLDGDELSSFLGDIEASPESVQDPVFGTVEYEEIPAPETLDAAVAGDEENVFEGATTSIGDGACIVCGAPTFRPPGLTKTGRKKRVPKHCDLHAPHVRIPDEGPRFEGVESQLRRIQEELADDLRLLGTLTGPFFPVTGYYVLEHADPFTIALLKLCKNNQRMLRVLHRAASVAPVYTVAECVAGTAYAVQVDTHKADPHSNIARRLGVSRAYDTVYVTDSFSNGNNNNNNGFQGPPRYATVQ